MKLFSMVRMVFSALSKPKQHIRIEAIPQGKVIDIGGGGEGVIAQAGGARVVAVDKHESEIDEARSKAPEAQWVVADATALPFEGHSFDNATAFFSCMYMPGDALSEVFRETRRVLKNGGEFWIWDAEMDLRGKVFALRLQVDLPAKPSVHTAYGVRAKEQSAEGMGRLLQEAGFELAEMIHRKHWFFIRARNAA